MAVHAGLARGEVRVPRGLDAGVAVPAIHAQLSNMSPVGEGHRLDRLITDTGVLGREVVPHAGDNRRARQESAREQSLRQPMRSEEPTSEIQSRITISYAVFCVKINN